MKFISPLLKKAVYPALSSAGLFRAANRNGVAVLTYHGVLPEGYRSIDRVLDGSLVSSAILRRQLRFLKGHYSVISPDEFLAWRERGTEFPPRAVLLTCDDGLSNCVSDMLPILIEEQVKCLFLVTGASAQSFPGRLWYEDLLLLFLRGRSGPFEVATGGISVAGQLGSLEQRHATWWDAVRHLSQFCAENRSAFLEAAGAQLELKSPSPEQLQDRPCRQRFNLLTASELQALVSAGMTIGAHSVSHPMLSKASDEIVSAEISESKAMLESVLQKRIWAFAYPFGSPESVNAKIVSSASHAGFSAAFLNYGGGLGVELPPHAIPRIHVTAEMSLAELESHVCGFYPSLKKLSERFLRSS